MVTFFHEGTEVSKSKKNGGEKECVDIPTKEFVGKSGKLWENCLRDKQWMLVLYF